MGNADRTDVMDAAALDRLVLLLVADVPVEVRLADSGALHRALVAAQRQGRLPGFVARLGHRPDPMIGRRVTGLDEALARLVHKVRLVEASAARWRVTPMAAAEARRLLAVLPFGDRRAVGELAASWRLLVQQDAERREAGLRQTSSV